MIIIITGVAGSGKTTIGTLLASQLGWPFFDADEFHPLANIEKMSKGTPLTDADRWPWLDAIRSKAQALTAQDQSGVFTCSALKHVYRSRLRQGGVAFNFVYLKGNYALIEERMKQRQHFMKPGMLVSQFETLEEPHDALVIDIGQSPEGCVNEIREGLRI